MADRSLWSSDNVRRLTKLILVLTALPLVSATVLMLVEDWPFFDALWMAVITLTTVGYSEVHELTTGGRIVVMGILVVGLGVFFYGIVQVGEVLVRMQLSDLLGMRRMDTAIRTMHDHLIICGYGRMGRSLCRELEHAERSGFVVIDRDQAAVDDAREHGRIALCGDATDDDLLTEAGIARARGLAAVMPSDADNLFVVMSARLLNRGLQILARATDDKAATKLERAGADRVVSLYEAGAHRMAELLTNPQVEDFVQVLTAHGDRLDLAEIVVARDAAYAGRALRDCGFREQGVLVVGLQKPGQPIETPPAPGVRIEPGDLLLAFGHSEAVARVVGDIGQKRSGVLPAH